MNFTICLCTIRYKQYFNNHVINNQLAKMNMKYTECTLLRIVFGQALRGSSRLFTI